ncbi:hypothetical protein CR513_20021, partial [Mucuna pruriens]
MENNDRTLKELATLDVAYQPWCIQYPQLEPAQTYELKSGLIHLLPKFHGLVGEDPYKHLKEFHMVYSTMRPQGILEDYTKMKAFPFSLDGAAKDWLYLQLILFNTLGDMKRMFLEKFFLASRTATIRKEICGIRQHVRETLHEYWERFNKLCVTCPHHQISLTMMDRSMTDAASGGALMDKTTALTKLTSLVRQLAVGQHQPSIAAKVSGICTSVEHPTGMCPILQETESDYTENVEAIVWKATISANTESRAICISAIWIRPEYTSKTNRLSTTDSIISGTTVPTTTTENASSRQFTIFGGPDEATRN